MTTKLYSHYLPFLAQDHSILLLSDQHFDSFDEVRPLFSKGIQRNMESTELENINITLFKNNIDLVVLDATNNIAQARQFIDAIYTFNSRMVVLLLIDKQLSEGTIELMRMGDHILFAPFTHEELKGKLLQILSVFYTILSVGRRELNLKIGSEEIINLSDYLDFYEGSSLFIVDELIELNQRLKSGELSKEILVEISSKINEIAEVFDKSSFFERVAPTFKDLSHYLNALDFSKIHPSDLKAFDYLTAIVDDLNKNLMDIFVDRIFHDVHIFEDSLRSNIEFMINHLDPNGERNNGELIFFND